MPLASAADTPWRRLPWLVPSALAISIAALIGFDRILGGGFTGPEPARPVEVGVLELPKPVTPPSPVAASPPVAPMPPSSAPALAPPQPPHPPAAMLKTEPPPLPPAVRVKPAPPAEPRVAAQSPPDVKRQSKAKIESNSAPPVTKSDREQLDRMYHVGHDEAGNPVEPIEGPLRAAGSARLPPLTKEQWAALDRIYRIGAGTGASSPEVMKGPLRAAASVQLPPLTKAQWAHLDRLYHVGLSGYFDLAQLQGAELQSAASEAALRGRPFIEAVIKTPTAAIDYSRNPAHVAHSDMAARAIAQPLPRLPAGLSLQHLPTAAVARFHIAADGAESVELQQRTSDEALDGTLLDALKMWRFTPAYKDGQAVASTVDVQLTISILK